MVCIHLPSTSWETLALVQLHLGTGFESALKIFKEGSCSASLPEPGPKVGSEHMACPTLHDKPSAIGIAPVPGGTLWADTTIERRAAQWANSKAKLAKWGPGAR